jgi:16S rRNA C967 or C1407 C5-methylase (RsmB/RsmF family)
MSSSKQSNANKKRQRSNPLAAARGNAKRAEQLWHRKTGAGFSLFVEFYAGQPDGVCCHYDTLVDADGESADGESGATLVVLKREKEKDGGAGLSRAAKRRKKKKGQNVTESVILDNDASTTKEPEPELVTDPRLCRALDASALTPGKKQALRPLLVALSQPLPLTFRIRRGLHMDLKQRESLAASISRDFSQSVKELPFDADSSIYQARSSSLSKASLSKGAPELKAFLVQHSTDGTIARQELGSMLPVLALAAGGWVCDTKQCRVLDLCASPGSKTLQALEIVGAASGSGSSSSTTSRVKANDINATRLESLQQAVARSGLPKALRDCVKYTCQDATQFPIPITEKRLYDAVICDVPCSGDGTVRKDKHILPAWTPVTANALHALQVSLLKRALACTRPGGVVSYSTCSLNPVEDEAVVAAAVSQVCKQARKKQTAAERQSSSRGQLPSIELVPWPGLPGFIHRPGVTEWKIADYVVGDKAVSPDDNADNNSNGNNHENDNDSGDDNNINNDDETVHLSWYSSFDDAAAAKMVHATCSMWPPPPTPTTNDTVDKLHLERCVRLWPQDHDTGGFFVALLRKNW